jgi:spermidine synthase
VAAVERADGHRAITVNAGYSLGSTSAFIEQANQARIPLHLFPETESICFIGMGTGMSAGAAFHKRFPNVRRVVTCELSPAVVEAAGKWIPPLLTGGLFSDPRSTVLIEDGRHFLKATDGRFDMINADLFLPYQRGAGGLYSLDHYQAAARRLNPDGVFVQWLPLYQLTESEFGVIARTMMEVFGEVTMWRNNFVPGSEKVALIGRLKPLAAIVPPDGDGDAMRRAVEGLEWWQTTPDMVRVEADSAPFFYAGNLTAARALFEAYPINTDDKPVIEYQTPWKFREVAAHDEVIWCVGPRLIAWIDRIFEASPVDRDPLWSGHPASSGHMVRAGVAFHRAMVGKAMGRDDATQADWDVFKREWSLGAR